MDNEDLLIFSQRVRQLRNELNLTQKEFAEKIGLTASALSAYENNTKNPSLMVARKIATKYNVSIDWLCGVAEKGYELELKTYADIYKALINICDNFNYDLECQTGLTKSMGNIGVLKLYDNNITDFFCEWKKTRKLLSDKLIDSEMYDNLLDVLINKYDGDLKLSKEPYAGPRLGVYLRKK